VSFAAHPVGRTPFEIHHRKDSDASRLDLVEKSIREPAEEAATNITKEDRPGLRMGLEGLYAAVDFLEEGRPQPRLLSIVVLRGLVEFAFCEPMELG